MYLRLQAALMSASHQRLTHPQILNLTASRQYQEPDWHRSLQMISKWRRIIYVILAIIYCSPMAYAMSTAPPHPIVIGIIYNQNETQSILDDYAVRGAKLAAQEINAAGGVLGRPL